MNNKRANLHLIKIMTKKKKKTKKSLSIIRRIPTQRKVKRIRKKKIKLKSRNIKSKKMKEQMNKKKKKTHYQIYDDS